MTTGLLISSIHKTKLYKKYLNKPNQVNTNNYKEYFRIYNSVLRKSKSQYYTVKLNTYQNDIKNTWATINDVIQRNKNTRIIPTYILVNGQSITDLSEISNEFNNFFVNVGKSTSDNLDIPQTNFKRHLVGHHSRNFFVNPVTPEDVSLVVNKLKSKSGF